MTLLERIFRLEKLTKNLNQRFCCLQAGIQFQDEGINTGDDVTVINFTGDAVTTTVVNGVLTVDINVAGQRFGFPGEDDTGGEPRLFTSAFPVVISTSIFQAGDVIGANNGIQLTIDDNNEIFRVEQAGMGDALFIDFSALSYSLGDMDAVGNGTEFIIEDAAKKTLIRDTSGDMLSLDRDNEIYKIGDISDFGNGVKIQIEDGANDVIINNTVGTFLSLDMAATIYSIGDINGTLNGNRLEVDDGNDRIRIFGTLGEWLTLDKGSDLYEIGDLSASLNGGRLGVDDSANLLRIRNTANTLGIEINSVLGITGTFGTPTTITVNAGIVTAIT